MEVNLLLNRASSWADVDSHIPYQGRVDVLIKKPSDLRIRIPEWVNATETSCLVNGKEQSLSWQGRYALVGSVKPRDKVTLTFPISERIDRIRVEGHEYTLVREGNDVVSVDPPGQNYPQYQRDHYRENQTRFKAIKRFVSERIIDW